MVTLIRKASPPTMRSHRKAGSLEGMSRERRQQCPSHIISCNGGRVSFSELLHSEWGMAVHNTHCEPVLWGQMMEKVE